jgi:hypothetical protein
MTWWLLSLLVVSLCTAVVPVFSSELYLVGVMSSHPELNWWVAGPIAATGQLIGKSTYYLAARSTLDLPQLLRRPVEPQGRWQQWNLRFRHECQGRPVLSASVISGKRSLRHATLRSYGHNCRTRSSPPDRLGPSRYRRSHHPILCNSCLTCTCTSMVVLNLSLS